jgi:hypothetical protein
LGAEPKRFILHLQSIYFIINERKIYSCRSDLENSAELSFLDVEYRAGNFRRKIAMHRKKLVKRVGAAVQECLGECI